MKQPKAPCLGCGDRFVGCHGLCDKYIKFNHECEIFRAEKLRISEENRIQNDIEHDRIVKAITGRMYRRRNGKT
jgi:hypothetical protein